MRTFIAFELPENIITDIRKIQKGIISYGFRVKWVRPENIHLTLKFLGNIDNADIKKVGKAILESVRGYGPISLRVKGIGVFPGIKRPRVIWMGLSGDTASLIKIQKKLDEKLFAMDFPKEKRQFKGHLTLARVKGNIAANRLFNAITEFKKFESEPFITNKIILFKSDLQPLGAVYTKLMSISL